MKKAKKMIFIILLLSIFIQFSSVKAASICTATLENLTKNQTITYDSIINQSNCDKSNYKSFATISPKPTNAKGIEFGNNSIKITNPGGMSPNLTLTLTYMTKDGNTEAFVITTIFSPANSSSQTTETKSCYCLGNDCQSSSSGYGAGWVKQDSNAKCESSGNSSSQPSDTEDDSEKCCYVTEQNKYIWNKKTFFNNSGYHTEEKSEFTTKETCESEKNTPTNDEITTPNKTNDSSSSSSTTSEIGVSGNNACTRFRVSRVRGYNCSSESACKNGKLNSIPDTYFNNLVGSPYHYYFVYKTYYDCDGFDKTTPITSFCIDPALEGPQVAGYTGTENGFKYKGYNIYDGTTEALDINNKFHKGLYHLYTHWYIDNRKKIEAVHQQTDEDFVDFIMDNVARKLRLTYDTANLNRYYPIDNTKGKYQSHWSETEYDAYKDNKLGVSGGNSEVKKLIKEIWEEVQNFVENGKIDTSTSYSDNWVMPLKSYNRITGDWDGKSDNAEHRRCGLSTGKGWDGSESHSGIDFSANEGTEVYAAQAGTVLATTKNNATMGNAVIIIVKSSDGTELRTRYLHLSKIADGISANTVVKQGQLIGYSGYSLDKNNKPQYHLHFDVSTNDVTSKTTYGKTLVNPRKYLPMDNINRCSQTAYTQETPKESEGTIVKASGTTVKFEVNQLTSPKSTNNNKGISAELEFIVKSDNTSVLDSIIKDGNYKIVAKTDKNEYFDVDAVKETEWTAVDGGYSIKYKISEDNVYAKVTNKKIEKVTVGLQISYYDPYSISNIMILNTNETNKSSKALQDFVTFLKGNIDKFQGVSINFEAEKTSCKPSYAMVCGLPTYYLIEGTQSSTAFNAVMSGIKNAGDLQNVLGSALDIIDTLKNFNLEKLTKHDLNLILGLLSNFAEDGSALASIKADLTNILTPLVNKGNNTAKNLVTLLRSVSYDGKDTKINFINLSTLIINVLDQSLNGNGLEGLKADWGDIVDYLNEGVKNGTISISTTETFENIYNLIKSSDTSLATILTASQQIVKWVHNNSLLTNITQIKSEFTAALSSITMIFTDTTQGLNSIYNGLKDLISQVDITKSLADPGNYNILTTLKNTITVDWKKCIIGEDGKEATDPAGNSYTIQQSNDNGYDMFCSIVCKEDYAIKMPGNLETVYAGRYISTNIDNVYHATVGMAGQRTCVTTEIKNDKYKEEALAKKDEMLEAYNRFYSNYNIYLNLKAKEKQEGQSSGLTSNKANHTFKNFGDTSKKLEEVQKKVENAVQDTIMQYVDELFDNDTSARLKASLSGDDLKNLAASLIAKGFEGMINGKDAGDIFDEYVEEQSAKVLESAKAKLASFKEDLSTNVNNAIKTTVGDSIKGFLGGLGLSSLEIACNAGSSWLAKLFGVGEAVQAACSGYSFASTTLYKTVEGLNSASGYKIFQLEEPIEVNGSFHPYTYKDNTSAQTKLASEFVENNNENQKYSFEFNTWKITVPIMKGQSAGSFDAGTLSYGSLLLNAGSQITKLMKDSGLFQDEDNSSLGAIETGFNQLKSQLTNFGNISDIGSLDNISDMNFDKLMSVMTGVLGKVDKITKAADGLMSGITDTVDKTILFYYNFLGLFNPYYAALAEARSQMEIAKQDYTAAQKTLIDMASRMNACTEWSKSYDFNPTLEFTYGYPKNSILDYIVNRNDKTTEKVYLKDINKGEPETVSYYCDAGVETENVQDWDVITSGKCRTNDGIIGSMLGAFLDDDSMVANLLNSFKNSKSGLASLKKLISNSKLKEYIPDSKKSALSDKICSFFGQNACDIFGDDEDSLVTYIPGNIVYKLNNGSTSGIESSSNLFSILGNGGGISGFLNSLTKNITYGTGMGTSVNYKDAAKVVNITRYGNPGVSISGLNLQNFANMFVNYASSKFGNSMSSKITDALANWNGQGSQEFIYYKPEKQYWTTSNKGIYTSQKPSDADAVLVDIGDPGLTDPSVVSGTDAAKEADGKIYPIALSTQAGLYQYQIKINGVGQYYNNTTATGRIIGDTGYISGLLANQYVCFYEVKTEPETPDQSCEDILNSTDCQEENEDGTKKSYLDLFMGTSKDNKLYEEYENKANSCINKLLADGNACCNIIDKTKVPSSNETYNKVCKTNSNGTPCSGIKLYGEDSALQTTITTKNNSALISNSGTLQFYTKVVSNYDLFPNGGKSKGYNWSGKTSGYENKSDDGAPGKQDLSNIIEQIEDVGDGIYADDEKYLEYSITMNSACMNAIKTYNKNQEIIDLGFGDYSASSISKESREYKSQFLADIQSNSEYSSCKIDSYLK